MNKELEALKRVKNFLGYNYCSVDLPNELRTIEKALQRLESIDNANPSKALERLNFLKILCNAYKDYYEIFENALLKAQEQEKALKILKEKRVDLPYLRCCFEDNQSVERYNEYIRNKTMDYDHEEELTQEEFNMIKETLECIK